MFWSMMLLFWGTPETPRLPVIRPAPDFALMDQDEKKTSLAQHQGKVVFVSFVFTTCNGTCPATTHRLARIFDELQRRPHLKDKVHIVSITLDPERDRPEILRGYRRLYDIDKPGWTFATGPVNGVNKIIADWKMWVKSAPNGQLDHPARVFLVDPQGRQREIYNLDFLRVPWVMEDIEELLREK